ncbi:MAG: IS21 family transposase [Candidatus Brocadiae bacterium]|nr:IS21 family transposase [Candidatus Brocadiia bacterium]
MKPELWAEIRRLRLVEDVSKREIARRLRLDRRTVQRALKRAHADEKPKRSRSSIVDAFQKDVAELIAATPRMTAVRVLEELRRRGFVGGITVVRQLVAHLRGSRPARAFVRREFHAGEAAEVDWAHCGSMEVGGRLRRLSAFVMTLNYSRMLYLEFTVSEAMEEFLRCHQNAFAFFGGVPRRAFYDNLKTVVLAHVGGDVRFNPRFEDFAGHHLFKPVACNPAAGWEKGRVERSIQYIRSSFLNGRNFRSLEEINSAVVTWRDETANRRIHKTTGKRPIDLFAEERPRLLALPEVVYDSRILRSCRVTPDARIIFETNTYSVPPAHVGKWLTLRASPTEVCLYDCEALVARHVRAWQSREDVLNPEHARAVLDQKRRATGQTLQRLFFALGPEAKPYLSGLVRTELSVERHLSRILDLAATYGVAEVMGAIAKALPHGAFGADYVENIVLTERRRRREEQRTPLRIARKDLAAIDLPEQSLDHYDELLGPDGGKPPQEKP